jgi:hypothetical protein
MRCLTASCEPFQKRVTGRFGDGRISIGALSYEIYSLVMRMKWDFGLMEIDMININCLLTGFILNGVYFMQSLQDP